MPAARSTTPRRRHRAFCMRTKPPCALCGNPIDYDLPQYHPMSFVSDHILPLALGGEDTFANRQPAHLKCNADKGQTLAEFHLVTSGVLK